jgi:predicted Zn-dependent peptidase
MAKNEIYYGREVTVEEVVEKLQAVCLEDIVSLANDIFVEDKITFVSLGRIEQGEIQWAPVS